ncbi:hypothetical protein GCM10007389_28610 [Pontibacter akesuensis]|nr:hypothetical protein GCM10007389_28610 [Pontibacter akesuensis]
MLVSVSLIPPETLVLAVLLMPVTAARLQVKDAPLGVLVGVYVNNDPLHTAAGDSVLLSTGVGFTVTVISRLAGQLVGCGPVAE